MKFLIKIRSFAPLSLMLCASLAQADIWKCVDADGAVAYTNSQPVGKGCTLVYRDPVESAPPRTPAPAAAPGAASVSPKVRGDTQHGRDQIRRQILERELVEEQRLLEEARALPGGPEAGGPRRVAEHLRNIEALRQEIARLK